MVRQDSVGYFMVLGFSFRGNLSSGRIMCNSTHAFLFLQQTKPTLQSFPASSGIASVYASYVLFFGTISISSAAFTGYFHQYPVKNSIRIIKIIMATHYL